MNEAYFYGKQKYKNLVPILKLHNFFNLVINMWFIKKQLAQSTIISIVVKDSSHILQGF